MRGEASCGRSPSSPRPSARRWRGRAARRAPRIPEKPLPPQVIHDLAGARYQTERLLAAADPDSVDEGERDHVSAPSVAPPAAAASQAVAIETLEALADEIVRREAAVAARSRRGRGHSGDAPARGAGECPRWSHRARVTIRARRCLTRYSMSTIDEVKARLDIVETVGQYVP